MNKKIINGALCLVVIGLALKFGFQPDASPQTTSANAEYNPPPARSDAPQTEPDIRADLTSSRLTAGEEAKIRLVIERFATTLPRLVGNDPQALLVYNYYQSEAIFARPRTERVITGNTVPNGRSAGGLPIVIVTREEAARLGDQNAEMSTLRYRSDMGTLGIVIMDPTMMTEPWEEQSLLHELWHAYVDRVLHQSDAGREQIGGHQFAVAEEADAHYLGYRLLNHWTAGQYERSLDWLAHRRLTVTPNDLTRRISRNEAGALDRLFPPCANSEQGIRGPQYEIDLSVALARARGYDQNEARKQTLRRLYGEIYGR